MNIVYDIHVEGEEIYVCGTPTIIQSGLTSKVAKWDGDSWCTFNPDFEFDGYVSALRSICVFEEEIYIGGVGHIIQAEDPLNDPEILNMIVKINMNSADCSLGIGYETLRSQSIEAYPNPCLNMLTIECDTGIDLIEFYDVYGKAQLIPQENQKSTVVEIPVYELSSGIYFVKVHMMDGNIGLKKVIVE